jgi:hypothetical protein
MKITGPSLTIRERGGKFCAKEAVTKRIGFCQLVAIERRASVGRSVKNSDTLFSQHFEEIYALQRVTVKIAPFECKGFRHLQNGVSVLTQFETGRYARPYPLLHM